MHVAEPRTDSATGKTTYESVPAAREISVYDLMRHTSGLVYGSGTSNAAVKEAYTKAGFFAPPGTRYDYRGLTPAQEVEALAKAPLAHQPGHVWEYGLSTDILGRVLEVISGKRLGELLDARIFKPLQMPDTGFSVPPDRAARVAQPFEVDPATGQPTNLFDVVTPPKNDSGGVGAVSTASDYLRFCEMLLRGGALDGVRLVSRSSVLLMTADQLGKILDASPGGPGETLLGAPGYTFGLGFAVRREDGLSPVPGRAGEVTWGGASGTYFFIDPQEELIGIVMTQEPGSRVHDRKVFQQLVYASIAD
jgi:CubicO group peptidase (beta-lactamase class C family)